MKQYGCPERFLTGGYAVARYKKFNKWGGVKISETGKCYCLTASGGYVYLVNDGIRGIRRITPLERSRLQTIPEWYKWNCTEYQQCRMLGNGWTVEVIKHIFSFLNF